MPNSQQPIPISPVTAHDVAAYILLKKGPLTAMKLQKLLYYAQAWSLVWDDVPMFNERIEAWANGPVVPDVYQMHKGSFVIEKWPAGNPDALSDVQRATVDEILRFYGDRPTQWLVELTHEEAPWKDARGNLPPGALSTAEITLASMAEYYGSL